MPAQPDNPDGFWENVRFVSLNERLLAELGGAWDLPPAITGNYRSIQFDSLRREAHTLFASFATGTLWGWKDPRNCLTLSFWKDVQPDLKTVAIVRNPLEVAYSLRKRNGTSVAFGIRIWEIYMRHLLAATQPDERLVTNYDALIGNGVEELQRITAFIGLASADINKASELITPDRRNTHFTVQQLFEAGISPRVIELYKELLAEASVLSFVQDLSAKHQLFGTDSSSSISETVSDEFMPAMTDHITDASAEKWAARRDALLDRLTHERDTLTHERDALTHERDALTHERDALQHWRDILQHERDTFERERNVVIEHARRTENERDRLHERFLETNRQLRDETGKTHKLETHEQLLREEFRHHLQGTRKLLKFLDEFAAASERLRQSRRWKLSNPLAWIRAFFSHKSQAGFGHLDKVENKFVQWKVDHPETKNLEDRIQALAPRLTDNSSVDLGNDPAFDITPPIPLESLRFAIQEQPRVSIIIPVFNQLEFTHACLSSLQRHEDGTATEVIVVDDRSTDATPELIPRVPGLVYLRNDSNSGFIASCNHGAQRARGEYLLFLNNDTVVTAGWLKALLNTFATNPEAGLVGSKLVYPDGRLQEAGGIIWRDGTGWNRGKFQDARDPEYNYLREVDYCSGASLIIPRSLFGELGGFDSRYSPAYYEDTDLAFRVRGRGHKVLYQPLSVVVHYEGITSGRDISTGVKQHQEVNRATFVSTWANELADKANNGDLDTWDALPAGRERILVVDHHLPMADRDSGSLRMFQLLSILSREGHRVTFIPDNLADIPPYGDRLRQRGVRVMHYPYCKSVSTYLESYGQDFDTVILSRCDFARKHISDVRRFAPQSRLIFDTVDLHFLRQEREAELLQSEELKTKAAEKRDLESSLIEQADQTWVVSSVERELLRAQHPHKSIEIVSNIVEAPGSPTPFALRQDLLFIGSFQHPPNTDAVIYFVKEIFPHILAHIPEVKFYVIGDKAPPEVIALAGERVILTGLQANVQPYFDSIKLSVAPLRFGAGVKGKINQSMGFAVPVVATSLAIEGMSLRPGEDVMIADEPTAFAAAVTEVYQSEEIWSRLSRNGLANTKQFFSIEAARRQLTRLLGDSQHNRPDPEPTMASGAEKRLSRATTQ